MKAKVWYKSNTGEVIALFITDDYENDNLIECGSPIGTMVSDCISFELTPENIEKYMESADLVDLETIEEERLNEAL